jgi:predicted TIM-barrel fold metal-dependent hydrolase
MDRPCRTMGALVDRLVAETTEEWFRQHLGLRDREEAASNSWRSLMQTLERRPGGFVYITVSIVAVRQSESMTNIFKYRFIEGTGYVQDAQTKAAG